MTPHGELLVSGSSCDVREAALPILSGLRGDAGNRDDTRALASMKSRGLMGALMNASIGSRIGCWPARWAVETAR